MGELGYWIVGGIVVIVLGFAIGRLIRTTAKPEFPEYIETFYSDEDETKP